MARMETGRDAGDRKSTDAYSVNVVEALEGAGGGMERLTPCEA